ncbi:MAG: hypothetical protein GQ574_10535 [Crocinitomix sp.]|nr:hypothetical protein [Crocinitomix sp.]
MEIVLGQCCHKSSAFNMPFFHKLEYCRFHLEYCWPGLEFGFLCKGFDNDSTVYWFDGSYFEYEENRRKRLGDTDPKRVRNRELMN